jgi:hypothetical protein
MKELLKNKKLPKAQSSKSLLKEDYRNEFMTQSPKTYDDAKFEKWWSILEKNLSEDDLVTGLNAGLIANKGSMGGIKKTNEWLKMMLERKGVKGKWKELQDEADESLMLADPQPEGKRIAELSTSDDVLPVSSQVDSVPQADDLIPEELPKAKKNDWESMAAELRDSADQNFYTILDSVQRKGYKIEEFANILDDPTIEIPTNLKGEVALYDKTLKGLKSIYEKSTGKEVGNIERYMPRVREDTPDITKVGSTFIDRLDQEFGFGKQRTGAMTDYVRDPFYAGQRYLDQVIYQKFRPQIEALKRGVPKEAIIKEEEIVKKISQASDDPTKFKALKLLDDLNEKARLEGKEIIDMDVDYNMKTQLLRDDARKFKIAGIWEESGFKNHHNANGYVGTIMQDEIKPAIQAGDVNKLFSTVSRELPNLDIARLSQLMDEGEIAKVEGIIGNQLGKKYRRDALNQITEYLSTHKFHGRIKEDLERQAKDLFVLEKRRQDLIDQTLAHTRSMVGRAALGLNIRTSLNNALEPKRAIALGSKEHYSEALKFGSDPRNVKGILERYGIKVGQNVQDIIDTQFKKTKRSDAIEKIDKYGFYGPFNATEGWKDAIFLRVFENEGKAQGLQGKALVDFVMHRFDYYGHKYGQYGTVGLFQNKWAKTALQFAQYPMKEMGIYADMVERGSRPIRNKLTGSTLDTKASRQAQAYLAKITAMNVMIYGALSGLYGIGKSEVFGAIPFNIQPSERGLQVSISPLISLAQDLGYGIINAKADAEANGEDLDLAELFTRKAKRTLASTVIPAGNQLINKTGVQNFDPTGITDEFFSDSAISDLERGYNPTASGMARFLAPDDIVNKGVALAFGPYATDQSREYFDGGNKPLGENQTKIFDTLFAKNPEFAKKYFGGVMDRREADSSDKKLIKDILNGKKSSDALAGTDIGATPVMNGKMTIQDLIAKDEAESDKRSKISEVLYGEDFKEATDEMKMEVINSYGYTQKDIEDVTLWKLKNTDAKDRATLIAQDTNPDFVNYFKNEILTLDVAKELERMGKIPDADALMENMKMTDPYYQRKEMRNLLKKRNKSIASIKSKQNKQMANLLKSTYKKRNQVIAKPYKRSKSTIKKPSIKNMLISPSDVKVTKRKLVKVNFNNL